MTDLVHSIGLGRSGALLAMLLVLGALLIHRGLPRHRQATLDDRLAPYLRDTPRPSRLLAVEDVSLMAVVPTVLRPLVGDLAGRVDAILGGTSSVRRRLQRAGHAPETDHFRAEQVVYGFVGAFLGVVLGMLWVTGQGRSPIYLVVLVLLGFAIGIVARDGLLSREAERREARILAEFPTVAELLALAVGAGEGAAGALERIVRLSAGVLPVTVLFAMFPGLGFFQFQM